MLLQAKTEPREDALQQRQGMSASKHSSAAAAEPTPNDTAMEAQGDNEQPESKHPSIFPQPQTARDNTASAGDQNAAAGDGLLPTVGSAKDLQEGEAGESTPNLEGSSRVPAGHIDHGLPAEGLRMHTEPGTLEKVSGRGVGRGSNSGANSHQALNKKVCVCLALLLIVSTEHCACQNWSVSAHISPTHAS